MGNLEEVDLDEGEIEWGEYMRIWVCIDVTKPSLRRKKLNFGLQKPVWVHFSYERLPDICFCCGVLGHNHRDSPKWEIMKNQCEEEGFPYEIWMQAGHQGGSFSIARRNTKENEKKAKLINTNTEVNPPPSMPFEELQSRIEEIPIVVPAMAPFMAQGEGQNCLHHKGNMESNKVANKSEGKILEGFQDRKMKGGRCDGPGLI